MASDETSADVRHWFAEAVSDVARGNGFPLIKEGALYPQELPSRWPYYACNPAKLWVKGQSIAPVTL